MALVDMSIVDQTLSLCQVAAVRSVQTGSVDRATSLGKPQPLSGPLATLCT